MIDSNRLIAEMNRLGVHFIMGEEYTGSADPIKPASLLAELVSQSDARMRMALIAILLQRPDLAKVAQNAVALLDEPQQLIFKLYYTAAYYLQIAYTDQLLDVLGPYNKLPDFYSEELNIKREISVTEQLNQLAQRHKEITGFPLNWYGTYNHAAQRVISRLKKERAWATV